MFKFLKNGKKTSKEISFLVVYFMNFLRTDKKKTSIAVPNKDELKNDDKTTLEYAETVVNDIEGMFIKFYALKILFFSWGLM